MLIAIIPSTIVSVTVSSVQRAEFSGIDYSSHSLPSLAENFDMGGLVCTCMIAITLMMIYGTIKGKPSHLLPFFCLQLFDFAITT